MKQIHHREAGDIVNDSKDLFEKVKHLLLSQYFAVLSSVQSDGSPYSNIIGFAATDDLKHLVFATPRNTRKFDNLVGEPRVSLLVDNRSNSKGDIHDAAAVTILGAVREIDRVNDSVYFELYAERHPHLADFLGADDTAVVAVSVNEYCYVSKFQSVMTLSMK